MIIFFYLQKTEIVQLVKMTNDAIFADLEYKKIKVFIFKFKQNSDVLTSISC